MSHCQLQEAWAVSAAVTVYGLYQLFYLLFDNLPTWFSIAKAKLQLAFSIFNSTLVSCYVPEFYHTTCILYDYINDSSHTACNLIVWCYWIWASASDLRPQARPDVRYYDVLLNRTYNILSHTTWAQHSGLNLFYLYGGGGSSSHYSTWMHLLRLPGILYIVIALLMVSCGALRCSWERETDFRGLDRHRAACKHYQKVSKLAAEKRRDRARESTLRNLTSQLNAASGNSVAPVSLNHQDSTYY
jgi:hypothetical protein